MPIQNKFDWGWGLDGNGFRYTASIQAIGKRTILLLVKIIAVDLPAGDPIFGGRGTQRLQIVAFVAPPSGVVPQRSWAASLSTEERRSA